MLSSEIRVSRIGSIPFMKNKGCDSFDLRNHIFMSEIFSHLQRCYLHSFCFKKMTDFAADKSILIKIAFLPYPRNIRFPGEIHKALASYSHTIADTAYISVNIPISCRIPRLGKGPWGTDVIIIQELIPPHLRMYHKAVIVYKEGKIRMNIISQIINRFIIKCVNII